MVWLKEWFKVVDKNEFRLSSDSSEKRQQGCLMVQFCFPDLSEIDYLLFPSCARVLFNIATLEASALGSVLVGLSVALVEGIQSDKSPPRLERYPSLFTRPAGWWADS